MELRKELAGGKTENAMANCIITMPQQALPFPQ
jgi:hypothetical protein